MHSGAGLPQAFVCVFLQRWHRLSPLCDRALKKQMQLVQNTRVITALNVHILLLFPHMFWQRRKAHLASCIFGQGGELLLFLPSILCFYLFIILFFQPT